MATNLALLSYKATGASASRTLGSRAADVIDVRDYGADPSYSASVNTAALQVAINKAFASNGLPHGNTTNGGRLGAGANKPLVFGPGTYNIETVPLVFTGVRGGIIRGSSRGATIIQQTTPAVHTVTTNGFELCTVSDINFRGEGQGRGATYFSSFDLNWDGDGSNAVALQRNTFDCCDFGNTGVGCLIGKGAAMGSENAFNHCAFDTCYTAGLLPWNQNALMNNVYGGNVANCGIGLFARGGGGSIPIVLGVSFQQNRIASIQINVSSPDSYLIAGCRDENTYNFIRATDGVISVFGNVHKSPFRTVSSITDNGAGKMRLNINLGNNSTPGYAGLLDGDVIVVRQITGTNAAANGTHTVLAVWADFIDIDVAYAGSGSFGNGDGFNITLDGTDGHFMEGVGDKSSVGANYSKYGDITGVGQLSFIGPLSSGSTRVGSGIDSFEGNLTTLRYQEFIKSYTANATLKKSSSGQTANNAGATGAVVFTLPGLSSNWADGVRYRFYVTTAQSLTIQLASAMKVQDGSTLSAANGTIVSSTVGSFIEIMSAPRLSTPVTAIASGSGGQTDTTVGSTTGIVDGDPAIVDRTLEPTGINVSDGSWTLDVTSGTHATLLGTAYDAAVAARFVSGGTLKIPGWIVTSKSGTWVTT